MGPLTASEASLRLNYVLSQDAYGAGRQVSLGVSAYPVPDLAVGRLVETAAQATGVIDAYLNNTTGGVVPTPTSSLVTGYDFMADGAASVQSQFTASLANSAVKDTLIAPNNILPSDPQSWTASQLRTKLLGSRHDLVFLAGHFSANTALAADYSTELNAAEVAAAPDGFFRNSIVFSQGCHSGYSLVDGDWIPNVTQQLDWAQAFASRQATLIAGTGYQYGDTDLVQYSEALYAGFAKQLHAGTGPVSVGQALLRAKIAYLASHPTLESIDTKALLESTVFGLPMLSVNLPNGRGPVTGESSIASPTTVDSGAGVALGLQSDDVSVDTSAATTNTKTLKDTSTSSTFLATWLSGPDGVEAKPNQPALPLFSDNASVSGASLRGVGFRGGAYTDIPGIIPLSGAVATEVNTPHPGFSSQTFFPAVIATPNYFESFGGGQTRLLVTPAQHRAEGPLNNTATLRKFSSVDVRLFYSGNTSAKALTSPPSIVDVTAVPNGTGNQILFDAHVSGDPAVGLQGVWITYTGFAPAWSPLDLEQDPSNSGHWTGSLAIPSGKLASDIRFMIQAVNGVGLVGRDDNRAAYYSIEQQASIPTPATTTTTLDAGLGSVVFGGQLTVGATLGGATPLSGQPVQFAIGGVSRTVPTDSSGHAETTLTATATPGAYTLSASYLGDADNLPSKASRPLTIDKAATSVALVGPSSGAPGADTGIVATLTDNTGAGVGQRSIFFVVSSATPANALTRTVITDYAGKARLGALSLPGGAYSVTANFNGTITLLPSTTEVTIVDDTYKKSSASAAYTIAAAQPQTITFGPLAQKTLGSAPFALTATASSGLTVSYTASPAATCTVSGATVTLTGIGECSITASQPGNTNWAAATPVTQKFSVIWPFTGFLQPRGQPADAEHGERRPGDPREVQPGRQPGPLDPERLPRGCRDRLQRDGPGRRHRDLPPGNLQSGIPYDAASTQYTYVWKTAKASPAAAASSWWS